MTSRIIPSRDTFPLASRRWFLVSGVLKKMILPRKYLLLAITPFFHVFHFFRYGAIVAAVLLLKFCEFKVHLMVTPSYTVGWESVAARWILGIKGNWFWWGVVEWWQIFVGRQILCGLWYFEDLGELYFMHIKLWKSLSTFGHRQAFSLRVYLVLKFAGPYVCCFYIFAFIDSASRSVDDFVFYFQRRL